MSQLHLFRRAGTQIHGPIDTIASAFNILIDPLLFSSTAKRLHALSAVAGFDLRLLYTGGLKSHLPLYPSFSALEEEVGQVLVGPGCRGDAFVRDYKVLMSVNNINCFSNHTTNPLLFKSYY